MGYAREYAPSGYDGHFVAYQNTQGKSDVQRFLADVTATPTRLPRIGR